MMFSSSNDFILKSCKVWLPLCDPSGFVTEVFFTNGPVKKPMMEDNLINWKK